VLDDDEESSVLDAEEDSDLAGDVSKRNMTRREKHDSRRSKQRSARMAARLPNSEFLTALASRDMCSTNPGNSGQCSGFRITYVKPWFGKTETTGLSVHEVSKRGPQGQILFEVTKHWPI